MGTGLQFAGNCAKGYVISCNLSVYIHLTHGYQKALSLNLFIFVKSRGTDT